MQESETLTHTCPACGCLVRHAPDGEPCYCPVSGICPCGRYDGQFLPLAARALTVAAADRAGRLVH